MPRRSELVSYALIAAAVVLGGIFLLDRDKPTTAEQSARAGLLLRVFRPDDITRITIDRRDEKIEIVRDGEAWTMTSPRASRTEFLAVTSLINALQGARAERQLGRVEGAGRVPLGLDAPRARVELAMKGVTLSLALGAVAPGATPPAEGTSAPAYLEVAPYGDQPGGVFVVAADVAAALDRSSDAYRDPSLIGGAPSSTYASVLVERPAGGGVRLVRAPFGTWRLSTDLGPTRADADVIDGFLRALYDLRAAPFVPETTAFVERGKVVIALTAGGEIVVELGGPCAAAPSSSLVRRRATPPEVGCVPDLVVERILEPAERYRDRHVFALLAGSESAKVSEIEALVFELDGKKLVDAERRGDGLHLRAPSDEQVDKETADRFLGQIAALTGMATTGDLGAFGLDRPVGRAMLRRRVDRLSAAPGEIDGGSAAWDQVVTIGPIREEPGEGRVRFLRREDDGAILRLPASEAALLGEGALHALRNPNLLAIAPESITRVHAKGPSGAWELQRDQGVFTLATPKHLGADPGAAAEITRALATLTCVRWAPREEPEHGFSSPSATIDVDVTSEASPGRTTIEFGANLEGGVAARVRGRDPVCVLPAGKRDALLRMPVDPRVVAFDPTATPRIVVSLGARRRSIVFDPATRSWGDGDDAGAVAIARKLADAILGLRSEGLVDGKPRRPGDGSENDLVIEGGPARRRLVIGGPGKLDGVPIHYAWIDGIDATFAILREDVERIRTML